MKRLTIQTAVLPIAAVLVLAGAPFIQAGEFDPSKVPADAKWVIHLDLERICDSELADAYRDKRPEKVERFRKKMQKRYGIDPQDDFKALTLFSDSYEPHSGAAVLVADFDREKLKKGVLAKKGVKETKWQDYTLYTWKVGKHDKYSGEEKYSRGKKDKKNSSHKTDKPHKDNASRHGASDAQRDHHVKSRDEAHDADHRHKHTKKKSKKRTVTAVLVDDDTVVFAGSKKRAKSVVKLLKGETESLSDNGSRLVGDTPDGTFLYGAAIDLQQLKKHSKPFPILRQHELVKLVVGEGDGEMFEHVTLVARNEEVASEMKTALEGLVALAKVMTTDVKSLNKLYDDTEFSQDGDTVKVRWRGQTSDVVQAVEDACQHLMQRRQAKDKQHDRDAKDHDASDDDSEDSQEGDV